MGPIAIPKSAAPQHLAVKTYVNSELKHSTDEPLSSNPHFIKTISESRVLRAGDVIALGSAGSNEAPISLNASDVVEVSVAGIGTLKNRVMLIKDSIALFNRVVEEASGVIPIQNLAITYGGLGLTTISNGKRLNVEKVGDGKRLMVFIHGLGGSTTFYTQLAENVDLTSDYTYVLFDFEGHGLSPTAADSTITIKSLANDLHALMTTKTLALPIEKDVTIVAHSMGCLVAEQFALQHPDLAHRMVLIGPPPCPLPTAGYEASIKRAATVRKEGMRNVAQAVAIAATSAKTKTHSTSAYAAVLTSLLAQDPEGYAKGCTALASGRDLQIDMSHITSDVLIIAGDEDKVSPPTYVKKLASALPRARVEMLADTGHWHTFENIDGVTLAFKQFLS